ncbi:unnamed protein product [Colias eurytheme]|nr:unnamed protein product [Colias eurytheme]
MSSKRLQFLATLKEDAIKGQHSPSNEKEDSISDRNLYVPSRQESPIRFSKDFSKQDLQQLTRMVEDDDEEPSGTGNERMDTECLPTERVTNPSSLTYAIRTTITESPLSLNETKKRHISQRKDKGRVRQVHRDQWLDVKRKKNKNLGKEYTSRNGKVRKQKEIGLPCGEKCKLKCSQKFTDFDRNLLFAVFWSLGELVRHWDFIDKYCDKIPKRRITTESASRREFTLWYYLPAKVGNSSSGDESKIQVCKTMFLRTLGIKQGMVYSALNKLLLQGTVMQDKRGHHQHTKKISEEMIASVCDHVNSFVPVESHYVRERTKKLYLDGSLTFARMFLLYKEWDDPKGQTKVVTKVHGMPYAETSILYYKRKLTVYNFTIYEMEIKLLSATFGMKLQQDEVRMRLVVVCMTSSRKTIKKNEGDSVHALIERTAKNRTVYTPEQWYALIRWAKQDGTPYIVKEMTTSDFIDFKNLLPGCNWTTNTDNERVLWSQVKQLQILPESLNISYKTDFCEHEFKSITIINPPKTRVKNRTRLDNSPVPSPLTRKLTEAYTRKLPIPQAKLKDLKDLCKSNVIPSIYHDFYTNLIGADEVFEHQIDDEAE